MYLFRYDNSRPIFGLNQTGTEVPAIWSAGRDRVDGTDDDILGWNVDKANELISQHQQRLQMNPMMPGSGGMGMPMQPSGSSMMMPPGQPMIDPMTGMPVVPSM